jgi:SagB-type dehydrogenase family enzyme
MNNIGDQFQQKTKYTTASIRAHTIDWHAQPPLYKDFTDTELIDLPTPKPRQVPSLHQCLQNRKSIRSFKCNPLSLNDLSYLLWASTGISHSQAGYDFRTAPSAGALYPIETYVVANNIETLPKGLYHYSIKTHQLHFIDKKPDIGPKLAISALGQAMCAHAPAVFIWSAIFQRSKFKYHQRAYRYIYLDVGHIAQNLALAAVSLELGSCQIGAFLDDQANELLQIDGQSESVIYMSTVGQPNE